MTDEELEKMGLLRDIQDENFDRLKAGVRGAKLAKIICEEFQERLPDDPYLYAHTWGPMLEDAIQNLRKFLGEGE